LENARNQILNNLAAQQSSGLVPGTIWVRGGKAVFGKKVGHPPVWPVAVEEIFQKDRDGKFLRYCYDALIKQIGWFTRLRQSPDGGFFYADILGKDEWESGIDDGIRFKDNPRKPLALVDATSHVYTLYKMAALWAPRLGLDASAHRAQATRIKNLIQNEMFDQKTALFQDPWRLQEKKQKPVLALEGIWPLIVGAATPEQAQRVIDENILNPRRFFTKHPLASVGVEDPDFELRMWRGPAWNSMTYWAARGCMHYGRADAAHKLLGAALDQSAKHFRTTGAVWEFYHPHGGSPTDCARKPYTKFNSPCLNYLGHNPLLVMARLWKATLRSKK
ncbi:MAG: trehalase family glycosidase, partial [Chthoniobacterales bacterium]